MRSLQAEYGLTADQTNNLISISADLAAVYGLDLTDAAQRVQSSLRGEGEAAEALGLSLSSAAVEAHALSRGFQGNYETVDAATKAQLIYQKITQDVAYAEGAATEKRNTASGSWQVFTNRVQDATSAIGENLGPTQSVVAALPDLVVGIGGAAFAAETGVKGFRKLKDSIDNIPKRTTIELATKVTGELAGEIAGEAAGSAVA